MFARIAPGVLTMAVARYLGMPVPAYWEPLLPTNATGGPLSTGLVFFGGLTLLAASYFIGLVYEGLCSPLWRRLSSKALTRAAKKRTTWLRPVKPGTTGLQCKDEDLFKVLLQWLVCSKDGGVRNAFVHMHRFQAEVRLCAYSTVPLCVLAIAAFTKHNGLIGVLSAVMALVLLRCADTREGRRWIHALAILDELRAPDDAELAGLQQRLEQLGKNTNGASESRVRWCVSWFRKMGRILLAAAVRTSTVVWRAGVATIRALSRTGQGRTQGAPATSEPTSSKVDP